MGFDNKYPYTDFHEINLDWLLEKVKGIDDRFVAIEEAVAALREDLDIQTGRIDAALDAITFIQNHYPAMIASQYDESRQYDPGEIAIYDNELYICLPGETPGPWNGNFWNKTSLGDELGSIIIKVNDIILPDLTNINNVLAEYGTLFDDIVETYVPGSTYTKNQMVKYNDHIYRVMVASTNNPPTDLTDWDPETLANIVTDLLNFWNKIIPEYDETATYNVPDYVIYQGNIYTCNAANVTGAWDGSKWNAVILADDIASRLAFMYNMFSTLFGWFASYDDAVTYNKGDVVNYNSTLYECLDDNVTGAWDASKWHIQKVTDAMTGVNTYYKNFPTKTLSGNPVEIADAIKAHADSAIVTFNPVQEGTGTPSPGNPRPITGKDSLTLTVSDGDQQQYEHTAIFSNTVYGGTYNFVTGDGSETYGSLLLKNIDWTYNAVGLRFDANAPVPNMLRPLDGSVAFDGYCEILQVAANSTIADGQITSSNSGYLRIKLDGVTTTEDLITILDNYKLVFRLNTTTDIELTQADVKLFKGTNAISANGDDVEITYHYYEQSIDYTPDDRVVVIGTYSGKRVLQINHFEQGVSLDGSLKSFNILPPNAILINAWAYGKGNDDGTMAAMNPWWSTTAGDLCIHASSWASNTTADIWMYAQYVE